MKVKPTDQERLEHIIEAVDRIFLFVEEMDYAGFWQDEKTQYAVIKNFEIIGKAAYHLPKPLREANENSEWKKIIAFRHILVHDYYKINTQVVWNTIENKLVDMKVEVELIIQQLSPL